MQVNMVNLCEVLKKMLSHSIKGNLVYKRVVGDKTHDAILSLQTVACPAKKADVSIVKFCVKCCF